MRASVCVKRRPNSKEMMEDTDRDIQVPVAGLASAVVVTGENAAAMIERAISVPRAESTSAEDAGRGRSPGPAAINGDCAEDARGEEEKGRISNRLQLIGMTAFGFSASMVMMGMSVIVPQFIGRMFANPAIILGTITAVGGGILRDVFMNREPEAFQAGAMYGSAALIGSTVYALMAQNHVLDQYAPYACVAIVLGLRYASLFFGWKTTPPKDYTDVVTSAVARPVKSVARRVRPPKGKVERERERRRAYERLRWLWRVPGGTSPLPPVEKRGSEAAAQPDAPATPQAAPADAAPSDPSDRIHVDREELRRIMGGEDDEPRDPFEPRS